uniref:G-protein coupled receptors family 1 profile domain-containing protein n=1 Tax=Panagrolaimus sp. JU765 TaxID=591449 RepID=A0AC34QS12_9BILA
MGITSFNAFCADSKASGPDERIDGLKNVFFVVIVIVGSVGVAGNILNLFTLRSSLLQTVPFCYIRALALFDLVGLTAILVHCIFKLTGALSLLPIAYYSVYVEDWIINSFLVAGLYCAVLLTLERYLLLRNPHSKRIYISSVSQKICGVLLFSVLLHSPLMFQVTAKRQPDGTLAKGNNKQLLCHEPFWTIYSWYGFFRESLRFACVFVLVFLNIFIARKLQIAKRNRRLLKKHSSALENSDLIGTKAEKNLMKSFTEKRLTALMIAICFIYVIGNVPQTIVMIFQNESTEAKFSFQLF